MKGHGILEHGHPPEGFRRVFEGMLQILHDGLLAYGLFNPPLGLYVERIGIETLDLQQPLSILIGSTGTQLSQEFSKPLGI